MNQIIDKSHPNIYKLLDFLKAEEACTLGRAEQLEHGTRRPSRKREYDNIDDIYATLKARFSDRAISETVHIERIAMVVAEFK